MDLQYEYGELYMEFLKGVCREEQETLFLLQQDPLNWAYYDRIPHPEPDYEKLTDYHYKSVHDSAVNINGK